MDGWEKEEEKSESVFQIVSGCEVSLQLLNPRQNCNKCSSFLSSIPRFELLFSGKSVDSEDNKTRATVCILSSKLTATYNLNAPSAFKTLFIVSYCLIDPFFLLFFFFLFHLSLLNNFLKS